MTSNNVFRNGIRQMILCSVFLISLAANLYGVTPGTAVVFSSGKAEITLEDHLHHPFYWWPGTLLSYPIVFDENVTGKDLILVDKHTGKQQPFQLTGLQKKGTGRSEAVLHFISELSSGGKKVFILQKGIPESYPLIRAENQDKEIVLQSDKLAAWIPASQTPSSGNLPGPVLAIARDLNKRIGISVFNAKGKQLKNIETTVVNQGPLFADVSINYLFADGAVYHADIRVVKGYDFLEVKEEMSGFSDLEKSDWKMDWTGFAPTHRQAPNHPHFNNEPYIPATDKPGFGRYVWETIGQTMLSGHTGMIYSADETRIPFALDIFGNWPAEIAVTSSLFWDEKSGQSVGIFMKNSSGWDDKEYSIWHASGKLSVNFYYDKGKFSWKYPVANGKRSTAISCYDHQKDVDYMNDLETKYQPQQHPSGFSYRVHMSQLSHNSFLQNRYGTIDLNKIKDWVLTYPASEPAGPAVFKSGKLNSVKDLEKNFLYSEFVMELPFSGTCQNGGYGPTRNRKFYEAWVDAFNRLLPEMNAADRERFTAMFLFHSYVAADEDYMPMRSMLSGHPNFLADVKGTQAMASFLFPKHPQAKAWGATFSKYVQLNTQYHTRPGVKSWDAAGGRWTENLGTYVWGFLQPTLKANYMLQHHFDGTNHMANTNTAMIGSWLMGTLSAPYDGESLDFYRDAKGNIPNHFWGILTREKGPRRVHPPQGAHSARRVPPGSLWQLGQTLKNYDPLLSENISFVAHPDDQNAEEFDRKRDPFSMMYPEGKYDPGTPPDFKSTKFTGYGVILRSAVGTKEELSIHLAQIDKGPNYRWGVGADGGCGNIYFYAGGKSYSHNGREDSGDRRVQDVDLVSNFGVFKDGRFKSIGMNELDKPMFDLKTGQFTEITSSKKSPYSWPEYQGRSIMLVGSDYFILYDDVHDNNLAGRLSWFTHPNEELPEITIIRAGGLGSSSNNGNVDKTELTGKESKGVWYDSTGDFLTFVSHKKGYKATQTAYGGIITSADGKKDYIFRNDLPVDVHEKELVFSGTAGFIRERESGQQHWALFHGTKIGNGQFEINTTNQDAGISAIWENSRSVQGQYAGLAVSEVRFKWNDGTPGDVSFYLNGVKQQLKTGNDGLVATVPSGKHVWNLTTGLPSLSRPGIDFTLNKKKTVLFTVHPVDGATAYRFEYSTNAGQSWVKLTEQPKNSLLIQAFGNETKGYVRVVAVNQEHESEASVVYPIYFTIDKPNYPDGLRLEVVSGKTKLSWGKVLGCEVYRLYRRAKGAAKFQLIYSGNKNDFTDSILNHQTIYEYSVSAVNGNGESSLCPEIDDDPANWLNFDPMPGERFRRSGNRLNGTTDAAGNLINDYYPE